MIKNVMILHTFTAAYSFLHARDFFLKNIYEIMVDNSEMVNEKEIFSLLEQYGFQSYSLANLSTQEQAYLFYNANIIIGTHKAGFANCIFCKPNTKIIETIQASETSLLDQMNKSLSSPVSNIKDFIGANNHIFTKEK